MAKKIAQKRYIVFSLFGGAYESIFLIHDEYDELRDAQSACEKINQYCGIVDRQEKRIVQLKEL